jgi:hypothetical protein
VLAVFLLSALTLTGCHQAAAPPQQAELAAPELQNARTPALAYKDAVELKDSPGLVWAGDFPAALSRANEQKGLVFVGFAAVSNLNSVINLQAILPKDPVKAALKPYVLVLLHVDQVPEEFFKGAVTEERRRAEAKANKRFQIEVFKRVPMPMYVVVRPSGEGKFETVDDYDGLIRDVDEFVEFLRKPLRQGK